MDKDKKITERSIRYNDTLIHALKIMDSTGFRSLLIMDSNELFAGILSIGDIQRAIIKNLPLDTLINTVLRPNPRVLNEKLSIEEIEKEMLFYRMEFIPLIDNDNKIIDVFYWEDLFLNKDLPPKRKFRLPVVIMAGGSGTRMKPLTNVIPKPLIPIKDKTVIEEIFERFYRFGCDEFIISVNYKAGLIKYYLENQNIKNITLNYLLEEFPQGTAGSLSLLRGKINKTFFVINCDILIEQDYSEILDFHYESKNEITMIAALKHYPIPYGTVETGENGSLLELKEKPELTFKINSGMYILEPHVIDEIPIDSFFHITQLIENVKKRGGKVGVYPVTEKSWMDVGNWMDYFSISNKENWTQKLNI
jgi:dTDP-glucose pyrophosphorylase